MEKDPQPAEIVKTQFSAEFPTTGSTLDDLPLMATDLMLSLQETVDGIKKLVNSGKIDKAVDNVNGVLAEAELAIKSAKETLQTVDKKTLPGVTQDLGSTLQKIQGSMVQLDHLTAQNSPTQYQLQEMLKEVTAASRSIRTLTETLQRQPTSLIRGKQGE
jgi:paraquat-inducible protein B